MRKCGECTLCCKIPAIEGLKPTNTWCPHCKGGCSIYERRPDTCKQFSCWWLGHPEMPDEMRPDKTHFYVAGNDADEILRVMVDTDYPLAWKGSLEEFRDKHLLVALGHQVTFVASRTRPRPEKIVLDWVL